MGLINPILVGGSYIQEVDDICVDQTTLIGTDTLTIPDPEGEPSYTFRLHGFDLEHQTRTFRRMFRYPITLLGIKGTTLWMNERQNWHGIDMHHGATRFMVNAKTILKQHPELGAGIDRLVVQPDSFNVNVFTDDGRTYLFDLETLQPPSSTSSNTFTPCARKTPSRLHLTNNARATLQDSQERPVLPQETFLHGAILAEDHTQDITLIRSFTRTDEREAILSGVVNAQRLWQTTPAQLGAISLTSLANPPLTHAIFHNNQAIILIGGTILGLNPKNGNVIWKSLW
jgi:hypothetical protein